ncbi:BEL1-like homeodomain protein 9 [Nicotiana tabacum]|uniref:BEL1-like homeodomain protein 9 n=1 Tax=Nicotiana tabacum TaxID=4097 RepID=A0A1S4ANF4_TOBAC|nr:PREDICTED: BEL1-like homeodomain protein 9 [Nicotiana tabacum]
MAEGFEAYHVPQQSRRDRLRVSASGLLPFVDHPSLIPSDFHLVSDAKEKGVNFMDPQLSSGVSFQEISGNPFLYSHQNFRFLDQSFHGGDVDVAYKQEPFSSVAASPETNVIINNNNNSNSNNNVTTGQGLSLSLSSSHHYNQSSSSNLPLELNLQRYDSSIFTNDMSSKSSSATVPLGPFTGYASILKGSRFLKPAQQLLEELCDVGRGIYAENLAANDGFIVMDPSLEATLSDDPQYSCGDASEHRRNKSKLISMLNEVYRRYKQYYQQLQAVMASFESVPGLGNASPFAKLSLKALSKHFRCLKNAITDQLQYTGKSQICESDTIPRAGNPAGKGIYCQRQAIHNAGFVDHQPVWRPQRGLPERAVTVLRAWLFDHFLHPYPTDSDKVMLAKQTGLSRNQVSNWFINARVRLWKPMVEEIHNLETRQAQKAASQKEGQNNNNNPIEHFPTSNSLPSEHPSTSSQQFHDVPSKRTRNNDPSETHLGGDDQETMNLSYDNFSPHSRAGVVDQMSTASAGNGGVSLTLGLNQNNNVSIGLSGSFPRNAARRFGIDENNEGFMFGGFETQNRQLGRDNNIIGGQLLHDFVG